MAVNKVIYGGNTVIDLTSDTVTADSLVEGVVAHDKSGTSITGTNPYEKTATDTEVTSQTDLISQIQTALESKAAGSGGTSVETCTVEVTGAASDVDVTVLATVLSDGAITYAEEAEYNPDGSAAVTVNNVVCGSIMHVYLPNGTATAMPACTNAELMHTVDGTDLIYWITASAGGTVTITRVSDEPA